MLATPPTVVRPRSRNAHSIRLGQRRVRVKGDPHIDIEEPRWTPQNRGVSKGSYTGELDRTQEWVGSSEDEEHSRTRRLLGKNSGEFEFKVMNARFLLGIFFSFGMVFFCKFTIQLMIT